MLQYQQLIKDVFADGEWEENRTGTRALTLPGAALFFNLANGEFPAITTKQLAFKSVVGELAGFLRGFTSAHAFREMGTKIWDQNANENAAWLANPNRLGEDHLGAIYGYQWRNWPAFKRVGLDQGDIITKVEKEGWEPIACTGKEFIYFKRIDQVRQAIEAIITNPTDRRILFHAWNPADLDGMALPPCHLLYQLIPSTKKRQLHMTLTIRSSDIGLGLPFNIASAAAMLSLFAHVTGYTPGRLSIFLGNAHIYEDHIEMCKEVLKRPALPSPQLRLFGGQPHEMKLNEEVAIKQAMDKIDYIMPTDFELVGYEHHPAIKAPMAV